MKLETVQGEGLLGCLGPLRSTVVQIADYKPQVTRALNAETRKLAPIELNGPLLESSRSDEAKVRSNLEDESTL